MYVLYGIVYLVYIYAITQFMKSQIAVLTCVIIVHLTFGIYIYMT